MSMLIHPKSGGDNFVYFPRTYVGVVSYSADSFPENTTIALLAPEAVLAFYSVLLDSQYPYFVLLRGTLVSPPIEANSGKGPR